MSALVVIFGRDRGHVFNIPRGSELVLGRSKTLTHRLNDPSISRKHLEFVHHEHDNSVHVVDMESRNGARINDKRLFHTQELQDGDIVQVGYTLLVYVRITFDASTSVNDFLNDCEKIYAKDLDRLRDHAARHTDHEDSGYASGGSMSGTLQIGHVWGKKK